MNYKNSNMFYSITVVSNAAIRKIETYVYFASLSTMWYLIIKKREKERERVGDERINYELF